MVLITISILFSIAHGAALPGAMYVFGDLTNLFVNYDITLTVFDNSTNFITQGYSDVIFNATANFNTFEEAIDMNTITPNLVNTESGLISYTVLLFNDSMIDTSVVTNITCLVANFANERNQSIYETLLLIRDGEQTIEVTEAACDCLQIFISSVSSQARCLTDDNFIYGEEPLDGILWTIYLFLMITAGVFIAAYIQISLMQTACERQVQKMRLLYYRSVLRQDIGWFDVNPSGEVSSRLNELVCNK